jgi:uncharacterized protein (DUF2147 family)
MSKAHPQSDARLARWLLAAGLLLLPCAAAWAQRAPAVTPAAVTAVSGVWVDDTGKGAIEIGPCGERLCGRIVWLKEPVDKAGRPLTDGYNPDARQRKRPICGLQVIGDLKPVAASTWDAGWIYDPKQGKQFDVEIKLRAPDRLQVMGYLGVKFLSETFVWTRAPATLPRCSGAEMPGTQATVR